MRGHTLQDLIEQWLQKYQARWIRLAVVEALYQGRYKTISVEQILKLWLRRGQPTYHFTHDFERLICQKLPRYFAMASQGFLETLEEDRPLVMPNQELAQLSSRLRSAQCQGQSHPADIDPETTDAEATDAETRGRGDAGKGDAQRSITSLTATPYEIKARLEDQPESVTDFEQLTLETATQTSIATAFSTNVAQEDNSSPIEPPERSIHQFIPVSDNSELYAKLRAVVKQGLEPGA